MKEWHSFLKAGRTIYVTPTNTTGENVMEKGNILGSAWGYGAINRDFYIVTAVSAKGRVKVAGISKEKVKTADIENGEVNNLVSPRVYDYHRLGLGYEGPETGYKKVFTNSDGDNFIKISNYEYAYKIAETGDEAEAMTFTETNSYFI